MTHEQAAKILAETWCGCTDAFGLIVALEHIGVLKLDRPPKKGKMVLDDCGYDGSDVVELLEKHGLQIVEKSS